MKKYEKELRPVKYSEAGVKVLHFSKQAHEMCFRIHWHERMELVRLHSGEMVISFGTDTIKLHAGEMAIFPPKMPHGGYTDENSAVYDVVMFDVRSFYHNSEVSRKYLQVLFEGDARFQKITSDKDMLRCFDTICSKEGKGTLEVTAYIYQLLFYLFERSLIEVKNKVGRDDVIKEIKEYMEENFRNVLTTASICEEFGYTEAHFCRKFKEATGLTPMNYLNIYRMEEAYKMLKKGEHNISKIAMRCGFQDSNYFTRCFKAHFGMPPSKIKA